jgi:hypothetical protein
LRHRDVLVDESVKNPFWVLPTDVQFRNSPLAPVPTVMRNPDPVLA